MNKELSIGEVGVIHGKTVLCVKVPPIMSDDEMAWVNVCPRCAFFGERCHFESFPFLCKGKDRIDGNNVYYPEITKGL